MPWANMIDRLTDVSESEFWDWVDTVDRAEEALLNRADEELLYQYSPGDGRGTRYVFKRKTCVGSRSAQEYIIGLLNDHPFPTPEGTQPPATSDDSVRG